MSMPQIKSFGSLRGMHIQSFRPPSPGPPEMTMLVPEREKSYDRRKLRKPTEGREDIMRIDLGTIERDRFYLGVLLDEVHIFRISEDGQLEVYGVEEL